MPPDHTRSLTLTWATLTALTLLSPGLGEWFRAADWLGLLVAAIIWIKGTLVAFRFIEIGGCHPFIRRVVQSFIAIPPIALIATTCFGDLLARWTSL